MGRLYDIAATVRPILVGHPSVSFHGDTRHRVLWKRIIVKATGAVALISIFSVAAASQQPMTTPSSASSTTKKSGTIQLEATSETSSPGDSNQSTATSNTYSNDSPKDASNTTDTSVQVTVNGQDVAVPQNGSTQQTVQSTDGSSTTVTVSSNTGSDGASFSSTFTSQNLNNYHSSDQEVDSP